MPRESNAAGRYVAIDLVPAADEDDTVPGWISCVPFDFTVRNDDPFPELAVRPVQRTIRAIIGDDRDVLSIARLTPLCAALTMIVTTVDTSQQSGKSPLSMRGLRSGSTPTGGRRSVSGSDDRMRDRSSHPFASSICDFAVPKSRPRR